MRVALQGLGLISLIFLVSGLLLALSAPGGVWGSMHLLREMMVHASIEGLDARSQHSLAKIKFDFLALFDENPSEFPVIDLQIDPADLRRLDILVKDIGEQGVLQSDVKKWFPATVINEDASDSSRIRIRGDQSVHWFNKKKSWRISFKKEQLFQRRRSINLIIPNDKMLEVEEAAYRIARRFGLLIPDSGFMWVRQNHVNMGLYLWVEQVDKYLLERLEYPEGEVFGGDDIGFESIVSFEGDTGNPANHDFNPAAYKTFIHKKGEIALGAEKHWHDFLGLLASEDPTRIDAEISRFLAIDKFAAWYSLLLAFGNTHGQSADNLKWVYDPTTGLFEPILYDVQLYADSPVEVERGLYNRVVKSILLSGKVRQARAKALHRLVGEEAMILATFREVYRSIEPYLFRGVEPFDMELPGVGRFSVHDLHYTHERRYEMLRSNIGNIKEWLSSARVFVDSDYRHNGHAGRLSMVVFPQGVGNLRLQELEIEPISVFPIPMPAIRFALEYPDGSSRALEFSQMETTGASWKFRFADAELVLPRFGNLLEDEKQIWTLVVHIDGLDSRVLGSGVTPAEVVLTAINGATGAVIPDHHMRLTKVASEIPTGATFIDEKRGGVIAGRVADLDIPQGGDRLLQDFLRDVRLPFKLHGDALVLSAGHYEVYENLIVPRGYRLVFEPGVQLYMAPNVNLLTFAPIRFVGSAVDSVLIGPLEEGSPWGAIGVVTAQGLSIMDHVSLRGGGAGTKTMLEGIYLTGQLNFYSSDVEIRNSRILDSEGEDGLNIKKARFKIENTVFAGHRADAFDGDWVEGSVVDSRFLHNGNDGLDLSGARVLVVDTVFSGMGDKAISAGEQSKVDIVNCRIESSVFGATAKDLSLIRIYASSIDGNRYGIASYRKKPVFGGGVVEMFGGLLWNNGDDFYMDSVSQISLDGVGIVDRPALAAVQVADLRIADIGSIYRDDAAGNPVPSADGLLPRDFLAGPETSGKSIGGADLPDLARHPVGMLAPLESSP
jgi:spore coat protein CotH